MPRLFLKLHQSVDLTLKEVDSPLRWLLFGPLLNSHYLYNRLQRRLGANPNLSVDAVITVDLCFLP